MINPLAGLMAQAELNVAEFSRRTAANIAEPIKAKGQEVVSEVVSSATTAIKAVVIKAAFGLVAGIMLIIAVVYAVAALYWELLPRLGPVETRLVMALIFAAFAVAAVLAMLFWPTGKKKPGRVASVSASAARVDVSAAQAEARAAQAEAQARRLMADSASAKAAADAAAPPAMDLKSGVETLAAILGEAGYRREQAGLRTGLALASRLKPMQIVALAVIGGYVAGLRYPGRRR